MENSEILEEVDISYIKQKNKYRSSAVIKIKGYTLLIEQKYVETIDEAVNDIKIRISKAVQEFNK